LRAVYPSLQGKRVLVTGGGSGIGAGIVEAFARQGCEVVFFDIAEEASQARAKQFGGNVHFRRVDLLDIGGLQTAINESGPFDVLVNNGANDDRHQIAEVTPEYWDDRMNVNLRHQFFAAQSAFEGMKGRGGGAIINLGSISWHLGLHDLVLYQTAKAAIEGLTRSLARELGPDNIRVTCVIPGNVQTPRQQQWYTPEGEAEIVAAQALKGRLVPEDVAALVLFLASADARLVTGHSYWVDAGWR
jgi:NAD(P)-dependent dehydrogenase (short-subunit alcohol dehydrogenase family)